MAKDFYKDPSSPLYGMQPRDEEASSEKKRMVPEPVKSYELGDELNRGVNAEWWRMAQCRAKAKAKWGNGRVNARAVEAETLRLYRQSNW